MLTAIENGDILHSPTRRIGGTEVKPLPVADPAYKLTTWCMKPFPQTRALTDSQRDFNKSLSSAALLAEPFLTVHMLCTEKRLCTNPVNFLLSMLSALLSNSFEPMPNINRCAFLTVSFRRHFYLLPAG